MNRPRRGAAAVEFALVLPVLMLILLGMLDYGWYFLIAHTASTAAREGARVATTLPGACGTTLSETEAITAAKQRMATVRLSERTTVLVVCDTVAGDPEYQVSVEVKFPQLTGYSLIPLPREGDNVRVFTRATMRGVP